jgi:hypothetical protein
MTIADKRKAILAYLKKNLAKIDPTGFTDATDKQFEKLMLGLKHGHWQFHIYLPNMKERFSTRDLLETAKMVDCKIFHRLWLTNPATGKKYLTRHAYPVYNVPLRRMEQFLDKKMSVPDGDKTIDGLTGQVTGKDKASAISNPEIQGLHSRGLRKTLDELVTVRGGDITSYGEFRSQLEEQGDSSLRTLGGNSVSRTAKIAEVFLTAMHIESNLVEV